MIMETRLRCDMACICTSCVNRAAERKKKSSGGNREESAASDSKSTATDAHKKKNPTQQPSGKSAGATAISELRIRPKESLAEFGQRVDREAADQVRMILTVRHKGETT